MDPQLLLLVSIGGILAIVGFLIFGGSGASANSARVVAYTDTGKRGKMAGLKSRGKNDDPASRRKQIEETLKKMELAQKGKKKAAKSLESKLIQADVKIKRTQFLIISAVLGGVVFVLTTVFALPPLFVIGCSAVAGLLIPRLILNMIIKRRQKKFVGSFADGMDIIVRGVRTGLPLNDCLQIIAHESPDPLGAEFRRVVEAESVGVPLDVCLEQMYERMPVSEVNFFATVLNIQKSTGGNLGESLANLSTVLRARKMLAEKIKALAAEAKVSAIIIGALPLVVMGLVSIMSPEYMAELFTTERGQTNLMIGAGMMAVGIYIMRKMIDFKY